MLIGAAFFISAFAIAFGYLTIDALRSGRLRGIGWFVAKAESPIRYWAGTLGYGLNTIVAGGFLMMLVVLLFVR